MNVIFGVGVGVGVGAKYNFEKAPRLGLEPRTCELTARPLYQLSYRGMYA